MNRAPAPRDTWWDDHKRKCGGEFTKVKEPENYGKRKTKNKSQDKSSASLKGQGNVLGTNSGNPSLPTFFDKMKKNQSSNKSSSVTNDQGSIKEDSDMFISNSSDENLQRSPKKPKLNEACGIAPFTGEGHVLGNSNIAKENKLKREQHSGRVKNPLSKQTTNDNIPSTSKQSLTNSGVELQKGTRTSTKDSTKLGN